MYQALYYLSILAFLVTPLCGLLVKKKYDKYIKWWMLLAGTTIAGWTLLVSQVHLYFEYICSPFGPDTWEIPIHLESRYQACIGDGGRRVFAALFGWVPSLIYSVLVFFAQFGVVRATNRLGEVESDKIE